MVTRVVKPQIVIFHDDGIFRFCVHFVIIIIIIIFLREDNRPVLWQMWTTVVIVLILNPRFITAVTESIIFIENAGTLKTRSKRWDGHNIRHGGVGVSGTEQTMVLIAEELVKRGHFVEIYSPSANTIQCNGVNYSDKLETKNSTIVVIPPWFSGNFKRAQFPNIKKLFIQFHLIGDSDSKALFEQNSDIVVEGVFPSNWAMMATKRFLPEKMKLHVINNPLMTDLVDKMPAGNASRGLTFVWAASFERGGPTTERVFNEMNGSRLYIMNYDTHASIGPHEGPNIVFGKSGDKLTVLKAMQQSSYFLYPLSLPMEHKHWGGYVNKDTFACCVAESLAMGTIVVTWKVAALPELYPEGEGIVYIPFPKTANLQALQSTDHPIKDESLLSDEAISNIKTTISNLESDPARVAELRAKGEKWSREHYRVEVIGKAWDAII